MFLIVGIVSCNDVFGLQLVYTGNSVSTHGFRVYGGPTSTAECTQHNTPAAGQKISGIECNDSNYSYTYSFVGGRGKVYTGVQEILSEAIDLKKLNEKIEARKVGQNYVFLSSYYLNHTSILITQMFPKKYTFESTPRL